MKISVGVRDESQPGGWRHEEREVAPAPKWRDVWRVEGGRKDPKKGQYRILSRGSGDARVSISLGWVSAEEAAVYERGVNALCRARFEADYICRAATGRSFLPPDPPVTATFSLPVPVQAGGARIPAVSDDWLVKVLRAGGTPDQKQAAQVKVFGFLRAMADLEPAPVQSVPKKDLLSALRQARTGVDPGALTLCEYVAEHWAPARREASPEGWRKEEGLLRLHVLPMLGDVALRELDPRDVFGCARDAKRGDGSPAAYNTRRLVLAAVSVLFRSAYERKHVDKPFDIGGLRLKGSARKPLAQDALTREQFAQLLAAGRTHRERALLAVIFGCGGRPKEIATLNWSDVTWPASSGARHPHGTIRLRGSKTERADRTIPVAAFTHEALRDLWVSVGQPREGTVFLTDRGTPYAAGDGASYYRAALRGAAKRAGLSELRITPYTARHTFMTLLLGSGVSKEQVRALAGHSPTSRTLEGSYDHRDALAMVAGRDLPDLLAKGAEE